GPRVVDSVVESQPGDVVALGARLVALPDRACDAVPARQPGQLGQPVVIRQEHPTLADSEVLAGGEADRPRQPEGAEVAVAEPGARSVSGILDQLHVAFTSQIPQGLNLTGVTCI